MRALLIAALALAGCEKMNPNYCPHHPEDPDCGGKGDGGVDAIDAPDAPPMITCFGVDNYEVCLPAPPVGMITLATTLDTTAGNQCAMTQPMGWTTRGQPAACFVVADSVSIMSVSVSGSRPLVVVANTIQVLGTLDAAGRESMAGKNPPGAPFPGPGCTAFPQTPTNSGSGSGGGAGASFMTIGGNGGQGNGGMAGNHGGTAAPKETADPTTLRAGCDGQQGGNAGATGGLGGTGGGVVYLAAGQMITFGSAGTVNASGGGGHLSNAFAGGGGAGSGGMIVLYAPMINATMGKLLANGGGGAAGSANGGGTDGSDPPEATPLVQAGSVVGQAGCCTGAKGFAGANAAENGGGGGGSQSGGGGGGGGGYIQSNMSLGTQVSPMPTIK